MDTRTALQRLYASIAAYLAAHEPWENVVRAVAVAVPTDCGESPANSPIVLELDRLERTTQMANVLDSLVAASSSLRWQQNPTYRDTEFLRRYAYCEVVGPAGMSLHASYSVGLLYLAPHTFYPPHAHPAEEAYHLLAGASHWQQGETAETLLQPGSRVLHPSGVSHSMRSGTSPMLALYLWRGDIATPARLRSN